MSFRSFSYTKLFIYCSNNSALTTSVVGTLKSVAQTTMGMFTFGGVSINPALLTGVTMNLTGGIYYTYAKYLEGQMKVQYDDYQTQLPNKCSSISFEFDEIILMLCVDKLV